MGFLSFGFVIYLKVTNTNKQSFFIHSKDKILKTLIFLYSNLFIIGFIKLYISN